MRAQVARTHAGPVVVLFIGNSLTYVNDLPGTLSRMAASTPSHREINVRSVTAGGATLSAHWRKGEALAALQNQNVDYVVLQGQSTEAVSNPADFERHAALFKQAADAAGKTTILLGTWARPAGDLFYREASSGGSPQVMQEKLNYEYSSVAVRFGIRLAPIGRAWQRAKHDAPLIPLLDGTQHPSFAGTYLAAAVLFRTLFQASPEGATFYGGLSEDGARTLLRIAGQMAAE